MVKNNDLNKLIVYNFDKKLRLGVVNDGGYVIADVKNDYDCYISCGVSNEESFSRDFINKYKMKKDVCYAFDGTINDYPWEYTKNINFIKKNIGNVNNGKITNLQEYISKYDNIFVKMDIEGHEYNWLKSLSVEQIDKFAQIVIEFHSPYYISDIKYLFKKICRTHLLVHVHGNNCGGIERIEGKNYPDIFEVSYVNKKFMKEPYLLNKEKLPGPLDSPNDKDKPEINLDFAPFCN